MLWLIVKRDTVCIKDCGLHGQNYSYNNFLHDSLVTGMHMQMHMCVRLRGPQSLAHCVWSQSIKKWVF